MYAYCTYCDGTLARKTLASGWCDKTFLGYFEKSSPSFWGCSSGRRSVRPRYLLCQPQWRCRLRRLQR